MNKKGGVVSWLIIAFLLILIIVAMIFFWKELASLTKMVFNKISELFLIIKNLF